MVSAFLKYIDGAASTNYFMATFALASTRYRSQAIYASFGLASGIFTFIGTFLLYLRGITASYHLFNEALVGV